MDKRDDLYAGIATVLIIGYFCTTVGIGILFGAGWGWLTAGVIALAFGLWGVLDSR